LHIFKYINKKLIAKIILFCILKPITNTTIAIEIAIEKVQNVMSVTEIKVKGYHLDLFGRVTNQRFLDLLEDARWSYMDTIGLSFDEFAKKGVFLAVVNINVNFRAPSILGDTLVIETSVDRIGNRSITVKQRMYNKKTEQIVLDAEVVYVIVDLATGKSIPIDNGMRQIWLELSNKKN